MNINSSWREQAADSALTKVSETVAIKKLESLIADKLKSLEGFEVNSEVIQQALEKTLEVLQGSRPQIKILGSHQEGDKFIVDVEVPLHMAHLFDSYPREE